ncbi:MAG: PTS sugar transporter subunit IIA [Xanthomonadaceae bacterium]|jgi:PTS system nitrogen regulatory IIA component|nr:PTS sugar transporter subunit IIA [Xanthomonadaceae bacterium]
MHLIDLLNPRRVLIDQHSTSKKKLLELVAARLAPEGSGLDSAIYDSLCARERLGSTGLGHGIAIPHGRCPGLKEATGVFVRLAEPVDFGAPDGTPVDLLFALAVPEHFTHQHLVLLSELAALFGETHFREQLRTAPDSKAVFALFTESQATHAAA